MKNIYISLLILGINILNVASYAQNNLKENILTDSIKEKLEIYYPTAISLPYIQRKDKYQILCTHNYDDANNTGQKDKYHSHIKAFNLKMTGDSISKIWSMEDYLVDQIDNPGHLESTIYWLNEYCSTNDIDGDGIIEPLLCYATEGNNGRDDGRLKIIIWYKGEKFGVRHQNGVLDFQRFTKVDKKFYKLPTSIKDYIYTLMSNIENAETAIFPYGWKEQMQKELIEIRE